MLHTGYPQTGKTCKSVIFKSLCLKKLANVSLKSLVVEALKESAIITGCSEKVFMHFNVKGIARAGALNAPIYLKFVCLSLQDSP